MIFDHIDFTNKDVYPSNKMPQWACLHRLISKMPGNAKMKMIASIGECDKSTITKALRKTLTTNQSIIAIKIAKRIAKKLKKPHIVAQLCPEYKEVEDFSK